MDLNIKGDLAKTDSIQTNQIPFRSFEDSSLFCLGSFFGNSITSPLDGLYRTSDERKEKKTEKRKDLQIPRFSLLSKRESKNTDSTMNTLFSDSINCSMEEDNEDHSEDSFVKEEESNLSLNTHKLSFLKIKDKNLKNNGPDNVFEIESLIDLFV